MKRLMLLTALLLSACSQAGAAPILTDLPSHGHVSSPRDMSGLSLAGGSATYRTRMGSLSNLSIGYSFTSPVLKIEFVSKDNWLDHHADVQVWEPLPRAKHECWPDPAQTAIICRIDIPAGGGGVELYGTARDAGTFHYAVRLSEQVPGTARWISPANGRELEWDEIVTS